MINAREYALKLISIKDRTKKELTDKLKEKNYEQSDIENTVDFLEEYGYINDVRYAAAFTSDAINIKKWGKSRIRIELLRKGIEREIAENSIEDAFVDVDESRLREAMQKRFQNADFGNIKERTRIFNFYQRRGFSPEEIKGAMNALSSFRDIED